MRPGPKQRASLCLALFALQALLPHGLVLCIPQEGCPGIELGIHGRCLGALSGQSPCGQSEPAADQIGSRPGGCDDSLLTASLVRQEAPGSLAAAPAAQAPAAMPLASAPGRPDAHRPLRDAGTAACCGPPGGLSAIVMRI